MDISYLGNHSFRIKGKIATVVVESDGKMSVAGNADGNPYGIHGPGEYEIKGVGVIGMSIAGNTVYRIEIDGISILHLGGVSQKPIAAEVDELDGVDILMVPLSDGAVSIISEIEPSIVIPMEKAGEAVQKLLKELGKEDVAPVSKLSISKDKIPEQMQIVVFS